MQRMQLLLNVLALSVLYLDMTQGQNNGTRVFDSGSTSSATGTSSQSSSSMSSGLSSAELDESFSSSSSSGSSSTSSSSSNSSSYSGPGLSFRLGDLISLFSPPSSSRLTPVSRQTRPRRPPSARTQPRVITQSLIPLGTHSKDTFFALFWPENPFN